MLKLSINNKKQNQKIECTLYLAPAADNKTKDCSCYSHEDCGGVNDWEKHSGSYLSGYTSLGNVAFETLKEAREKCDELSLTDCGGITFVPDVGYQPRQGDSQGARPSSKGEVSFRRPNAGKLYHSLSYQRLWSISYGP